MYTSDQNQEWMSIEELQAWICTQRERLAGV
jgi:hypothetical protein